MVFLIAIACMIMISLLETTQKGHGYPWPVLFKLRFFREKYLEMAIDFT